MLELVKEEQPLEMSYGEMTFLIKPKATAFDRLQALMAQTPTEFMERVIRQMVIGWKGVSQDGVSVKYSFDLLKLLPETEPNKSVLLTLGNFVLENTDVAKTSTPKNA